MSDIENPLFDELKEYAEKVCGDELTSILMLDNFRRHHSICIDTMSLFASSVLFAHYLFECPEEALKLLNSAFQQAALNICKTRNMKSTVATKISIHVRLIALPNLPEIHRTTLPNCSDVGQFMCISGTIIRGTSSKMLEYRKLWKCKKCKHEFTVDAEVESGYICEKPMVCPNPEWCNGKNFTLLSTDVNPLYCKDYQEVKIQEQVYNLTVGSVPKSMWVILEDDLVETCHPGNDVNVSGILIQRWKPLVRGKFIDIDLVLFAHNVEVKNKMTPGVVSESMVQEFGQFWIDHKNDPLKARDIILSSICPQVFGLYAVKLAVALILAGGVEKKDANSRIRGDSHLLLVGDPGTGKSQFLKYACKVSMRSVITSGIGTTNAGLTVSAVKEGGKWQLEAGALVLADGGICCIDEFSCIKEHDKTCIHEAMEQQTISVAKAGLVCSLSTRCSILAATNPKGKYDDCLSISENTALASPLLSRFDIILVLLDTCDEKWDRLVSSYILNGHLLAKIGNDPTWSLEKMRHYFSLIRNISPKVTSSCEKILQVYYKRQRSMESRNFARTTPRLLQSLIRLAEGHARLMFRDRVLVIDAVMAIVLMESSMSGSSVLKELTSLQTTFSENPKEHYDCIEKTVLEFLNLDTISIDSGNYMFSYHDSCVNTLLGKMSVVCKLSKKIDLFSNSESSRISSVSKLTQPSGETAMESAGDTDKFKNFGKNQNVFFTANNSTNEADFSSFQVPGLPQDITTVDALFQTERHEDRSSPQKDFRNKHESFSDEISTLSNIKNIFSDNMIEIEDAGGSYIENRLKRKLENERILNEVFEIYGDDSNTNTKCGVSETSISEEGTSHLITGKSTTNSLPTKISTFLKRSKHIETGMQTFSRDNLEELNSNSNIRSTKVSNIKNDPTTECKISELSGCTKFASNYFKVGKTVPEIIPIKTTKSNFLNDTTIISGRKCDTSTSDGCRREITPKNKFQNFYFQGRSSKNKGTLSLDSEKNLNSNASSVPNNDSPPVSNSKPFDENEAFSQRTIRPSQSVFKRIFPSSVQNTDLLDLNSNASSVPNNDTPPVSNSKPFAENETFSQRTIRPSQSVFKRIFSSSVQNTDLFDLDDPLF